MREPQPLGAVVEPRVIGRFPVRDGVQVGGIHGEPPAELGVVPDVPVAGHDLAHPGHGRQPLHPGAVVAERIRLRRVEQRDLHVGAHVAGHEDAGVGQEHRAVTGCVPVVHDQQGLRPVPGNGRGVKRDEPPH